MTVSERDRALFLERGKITSVRRREEPASEQGTDKLWVEELSEVWDYLADYPTLGTVCNVHRGIEWNYDQSDAGSQDPLPGYQRGIRTIRDSLAQFHIGKTEWLDCREASLRRNAINLPWSEPKVIANSVRMSSVGPWRLSAAADYEGLVASQQFFGIWILANTGWNPSALSGLINGPVANAYITIHSPGKGIRISALTAVPIPRDLDMTHIKTLVSAYAEALRRPRLLDGQSRRDELVNLLMAIDAAVLYGYDLPPRLERMLLEYFRDQQRPVAHEFSHWLPAELTAYIPLHEYLDPEIAKIRRDWVTGLFRPLPEEEVDAMESFLE